MLFAEADCAFTPCWMVLAMPNLLGSLYTHEPEYVCLYRGELQPDMAEVAPYLVWLDPNTDFPWWLAGERLGQALGHSGTESRGYPHVTAAFSHLPDRV